MSYLSIIFLSDFTFHSFYSFYQLCLVYFYAQLFFFPFPPLASSVSMVQLSSSPSGYQSPSGRSEEGREGNMKSAKPQVNHSQHGDSQRAMSPLQSALSSAAASPSQAYETYIDNGLICLKHKIRNIEKKKVTFFSQP